MHSRVVCLRYCSITELPPSLDEDEDSRQSSYCSVTGRHNQPLSSAKLTVLIQTHLYSLGKLESEPHYASYLLLAIIPHVLLQTELQMHRTTFTSFWEPANNLVIGINFIRGFSLLFKGHVVFNVFPFLSVLVR